MAQKTNLNVSPYFDDFSEKDKGARDKNYYKVLFNPGRPIQARELNTLQSILQNQVESFGSHIFKEGSVVIPGNITYDNQFYAVKLSQLQYNVYVSSYISNFIGKKITGQISGVSAVVQYVALPNSVIEYPTIYVKYINSDKNFEINPFLDGEELVASESVDYGTSTIISGAPFATTISSNATSIGSAASISEGVYFIRGTFVRVPSQTLILDYYINSPSYRVGLRVDEQIITSKDDSTLYDNAKGFTNYAAPGADRFKISLILTKKLLSDTNDTDFVELLRVQDGIVKKISNKSEYSIIKDYLAQRTYDESGNYVVTPFQFSLNNSLNNRLGNDGLFFNTSKTNQGNIPSDELMCIKFSPGKAYVKGYDIEKTGIEIIDVPKPRTKETSSLVNVPFEMGNLIRVNNVSGSPKQREVVYLQNQRKNSTTVSTGTTIGSARVYNFNVTDSAYADSSTNWDLYLFDIQTYTTLLLNQSVSTVEVPITSYIKGKSSGASGYVSSIESGNKININQTSGSFIVGEQILINGSDLYPRSITSIRAYDINDIKSIYQPQLTGLTTAFVSDTQLDRVLRSGTITITQQSGGISTATVASPESFVGIKSDSIIRYQISGSSVETYNRVVSVSPLLNSITLSAVANVNKVCDGSLPSIQYSGSYSLGVSKIRNEEGGYLYSKLPNSNVAFVDLSSSTLTFSAQTNANLTPSSNILTVNTGNFNLGINSSIAKFEAFDEERYSIAYSDGTVENLTSDKVSIQGGSSQVVFSNIQNKQISAINATFVKSEIQSKVKECSRSKIITVSLSKNPQSGSNPNSSINDGLTYNQYYGLRVQDEEICLRYPDVSKIITIYESLDKNDPVLDKLTFSSIVNVDINAIIGENIIGSTSNTVARVVSKPSANTLGIVYLNTNRFTSGENVSFEESNIKTSIVSIVSGNYKNITSKFTLDKGQREQYYDYSKLIRNNGESSPSKRLLIVFDYYSVSTSDTGDVFTVNSYEKSRFSEDIPLIGKNNVRSSDTLDFRPRVPVFTENSASPFDFSSRSFSAEPKLILSPNESSILKYDFYLGRIDKLCLDRLGVFSVIQGSPSINPKPPFKPDDVMEIATITLPPYLYNPKSALISLVDNRRYTMRDIGKIEDRVENLERVTSLSLLELNVQTLQIQDAQGINRFKTGFFVDDFKGTDLINIDLSKVNVDTENTELTTEITSDSLVLRPIPSEITSDEQIDLSDDYLLFDPNVQKTGDIITLKYKSVDWIEQPLATKVENVNPFNVIEYTGTVTLDPESDDWVRTIQLPDILTSETIRRFLRRRRGRRTKVVRRTTTTSEQDNLIESGEEIYMRSRNTGFSAVNMKPFTRFYQFLDGNGGVYYIPKLVEISSDPNLQNYGSSGAFTVGETVIGTFNGNEVIRFRVATSNHKTGTYNDPSAIYTLNPYVSSESIPANYSSSSKTLNIDIASLSLEAQGLYSGYLTIGTKLVGQTSGSTCYVKDLRLVSDSNGFISGSFFLEDPYTDPSPTIRIETGSKVYKLTSSSTNETPLPGSALISSGETTYESNGTWEERQTTVTTTTTLLIRRRRRRPRRDPLAQSFSVGNDVSVVGVLNPDTNGVYLTAVDLFFANKDQNNSPLTVEIRTVELGTPTEDVLGEITLDPSEIKTSSDASVPTLVTFKTPIYLAPGLEYAVVLLAPQSDQYEVWIAEMGEKTVETANLPDSQVIRYTRQFAIGSLFKSQNGSIWTANQYQDLKFKLYKANFTSSTGSVLLSNPTLNQSNGYVDNLLPNPITILPRKYILGISTVQNSTLIGILTTGRKVSSITQPGYSGSYGYIVGTGSSVSSVNVSVGGTNYSTGTVETYNINGNGTGLKLDIVASNGTITSATVSSAYHGNGYSVGDVVGIVTSSVSPPSGRDARITISAINGVDTLYLSNVQGNSFKTGTSTLVYYDNSGNAVSLANTTISSRSIEIGGIYSGNFFKVKQYNHGMYGKNNKLIISNAKSDVVPTTLSAPLTATSTAISVASTSNFGLFEGLPVGISSGYVKIDNEIIKYESVSSTQLLTITRGVDSTLATSHDLNALVYKYELGGVSLRKINTTHDISDIGIDIDNYYVEFDRSNRSSDDSPSNAPQLSFNSEQICGGDRVQSTKNIQFNSIVPHIDLISPFETSATCEIKTTSGTSVSGNETSFVDQGYESIQLEGENKLSTSRIICSSVNEQTYLGGNKSFIAKINLETSNSDISPQIFWKTSSFEFKNNRLNKPITDYINNNSVNSIENDPHASVYVSNTVRLSQPASSLKVILSAYRHVSADFRVLYSLIRPDSSEIEQSFELFPGYDNLTIDNNNDGYFDVVDLSKNSGLPDTFVPSSLENQFLEYEFTASNLGSFTGYTIKIVMSGTDQAHAPRFKDIRSIALA